MRYGLLFGALAVVALAASFLGSGSSTPAQPAPVAAKARPAGPVRPTRPPRPGDEPPPVTDEPQRPQPTDEQRAEILDRVRGAEQPGMTALRAFSDLYVDANLDLAQRQAESEGITLSEVRELTHFGNLVLATQRVPEVEEVLGRSLSQEERDKLSALMISANDGFKREMRAAVAGKATEEQRWEIIRAAQARYLADFFAATGMTDALLDDLLAGNMLLPGAPAATEQPDLDEVPPAEPRDDLREPARPR
jgi:hypothetical protein